MSTVEVVPHILLTLLAVHLVGLESCRNVPLSVSMGVPAIERTQPGCLSPRSLYWSPELNKRESNLGTSLHLSPSPDCGHSVAGNLRLPKPLLPTMMDYTLKL